MSSSKRNPLYSIKKTVKQVGITPLPTEFGDWTYIIFEDLVKKAHHEVLVYGDSTHLQKTGKEMLVRVHSSCRTNEVYRAINCECRDQLHEAMNQIRKEERGVIVYLDQEGRGTGIVGKVAQLNHLFEWKNGKVAHKRDRKSGKKIDTDTASKNAGYSSEVRDFSVAGDILKHLGIQSVRLLTNNPRKIDGLINSGINVIPVELHIAPENEIIAINLRSKAKNLGHTISTKHTKIKKS